MGFFHFVLLICSEWFYQYRMNNKGILHVIKRSNRTFHVLSKKIFQQVVQGKTTNPRSLFWKNTNNRKKERIKPQFKNGNEKVARQVCPIFNSKTYNNVLVYTPLSLKRNIYIILNTVMKERKLTHSHL